MESRTVEMPDGRIAFVVDDYKGHRHAVIGWSGLAGEMRQLLKDWACSVDEMELAA